MIKSKKNKILFFAILPAFVVCMLILVGCSASKNNTLTTISLNMNKVIDTINNIEAISNKELIIDDFMDENNISKIEKKTDTFQFETTSAINLYISKIMLVNNSICDAVLVNDELNNTKIQIIAKSHQVKSLCDQCSISSNKISNNNLDSLEELNNIIMSNTNRTNLSKNEIKNNLNLVKDIKSYYSSKSEQLCSRYQKLEGSLNTRLSYFKNILSGLNNMCYILTSTCDCDECVTLEETDETKNLVPTGAKDNSVYENNKMFRKNIDTYENAGKDIYGFNKRKPTPYDEYLNNNIGYNNYNNQYGNGYGNLYGNGMGCGNIYGYGIGMPFGYGNGLPFGYRNGFVYPNINTYGIYKNIDTYKPLPRQTLPTDEQYQSEENVFNSESSNIKQSNINMDDNMFQYDEPITYPMPKPMPKSFIPSENENIGFIEDNVIDKEELKQTDLTNDDGEDKFVSNNIDNNSGGLNIEKLD